MQLPSTGQVVKAQGSSLFNAKEKTFLLASKIVAVEKRQAIERLNKRLLIEFYKRESKSMRSPTPQTPELPRVEATDNEFLGSLDPTKIIREALNDFNQNEIRVKTEYAPNFLTDEERENLKKDGLKRIKPYLTKHLFKKLNSKCMLQKFLPTATVNTNRSFCKIQYKTLKWSFNVRENQKGVAKMRENAVNQVLKELFNIELVPIFFHREELEEKLKAQVLTAKNGNVWTSSLAVSWKSKNATKINEILIYYSMKVLLPPFRTKIQLELKSSR